MVLLSSWNVLCWNIRGLNSEDKQLALSKPFALAVAPLSVCRRQKRPLLICLLLSLDVLDNSTNLLMFPRRVLLGV